MSPEVGSQMGLVRSLAALAVLGTWASRSIHRTPKARAPGIPGVMARFTVAVYCRDVVHSTKARWGKIRGKRLHFWSSSEGKHLSPHVYTILPLNMWQGAEGERDILSPDFYIVILVWPWFFGPNTPASLVLSGAPDPGPDSPLLRYKRPGFQYLTGEEFLWLTSEKSLLLSL